MITALAVAIGVTILLGVLADFHAYQKTSSRQSWESTTGTVLQSLPTPTPHAMLWRYSENIYRGQFIEQLDLAALGSRAPVLPGVSRLPGPGQYYVSPALAELLKTVPSDELGDRFPGKQVGIIGQAALAFPNELAIYIGRTPDQVANLKGAIEVTHIARSAQLQGTTNMYREAFGVAALAILFPLLILIGTATRLSASRREERYAAMRLVGATPHQINIIASVDALLGSALGTLLGIATFVTVRPAIANISFSGVKFFPDYVTPTMWGYAGMIVLVPLIATIASLASLRRVQISPLGVSRKISPKKPKAWGLIPLVIGAILFPYGATNANGNKGGGPGLLLLGFLLIMVGITLSGSWLTMRVTEILARYARSAPALLAARRLADNPKGAYRTVSGLVLAVFVGSIVSVLVPALNTAQNPTGQTSLSNVLRVPYNTSALNGGLAPTAAAALVRKISSYPGTTVVPVYTNPAYSAFMRQQLAARSTGSAFHRKDSATAPDPSVRPPENSIASCASIEKLKPLGSCPVKAQAVTFTSDDLLMGDNPLAIYRSLPVVTRASQTSAEDLGGLSLAALLVKANDARTLEQIRTFLTNYNASVQDISNDQMDGALSAWQSGEFEPETIGEVAAIRNNDDTNIERAVLAVVALTLITAGCSLAVTVGGSLVERKRSFTLLRVSGVSLKTLSAVVLLEAALPLIVVSALAVGVGLGTGVPVVRTLLANMLPSSQSVPVHPSAGYYVTLAVGLGAALGLVLITLPLLSRMTRPEEARFE
jgi:hypothetical protein